MNLKQFFLILSLVIIDQFSKNLVLNTKVFKVHWNPTVAFSLPIPWFVPWIMMLLFLMIYAGNPNKLREIVSKFSHLIKTSRILYWSVSFIVGGAISNLVDRAIYNGRVVDFIDVGFWPVFNFADSFIVCGGILLLYYMFKVEKVNIQS